MTANQSIAGVVVFEADNAPKRIAARYYEPSNHILSKREAQIAFEKDLISKAVKSCTSLAGLGSSDAGASGKKIVDKLKDTKQGGGGGGAGGEGTPTITSHNEIVLVENYFVILRLTNDVLIAVVARDSQNDLLVSEYVNTFNTCLAQVCGGKISKKKCFDRLDQLFLIIDESIENGVVFEYDANTIISRINMVAENVGADGSADGIGPNNGNPSMTASHAVRQGIAAIRSGDTDSLRSVFAGAAQSFSSFLGR